MYLKGTLTNNDRLIVVIPSQQVRKAGAFYTLSESACEGLKWENLKMTRRSYRLSQKSDPPHNSAAFEGVKRFYKAFAHRYNVQISSLYNSELFSS